jgi:2-polyprenyl-3-methyl-5-hydroxy-6-metoxy-1,4-benzoquinol methylase
MKQELDKSVRAYGGEQQYDFDNRILLQWYPRRILQQVGQAKSLLELGLGHGYTADIFSRHFERHVVLDGSPAIIEDFRRKFPDCQPEIVETYFEQFESDEKFDVIVMGFILEHVDNPVQILRHFRSFLAPGGKLFVAVPNAEVLNRRLGKAMGLLPDLQLLSEHDHLMGHQRYYTVASLTDDIVAAGYSVARIEGIYLKPFTSSQMAAMKLEQKVLDALCAVGIDYPELSCGIMAEIVPA